MLRGVPDDQALQLGQCTHIALWRELAQAARSVDAGLVANDFRPTDRRPHFPLSSMGPL